MLENSLEYILRKLRKRISDLEQGGGTTVTDATIATSDITTNNVSTTKHGWTPKITDTAKFLKGDGTWATPTGGNLILIQSQTISGSAVTSVSFTSLDLATDNCYMIIASIKNTSVSDSSYYCEVNSDTTLTNYDAQLLDSQNTTTTSAHSDDPTFMRATTGESCFSDLIMMRVPDGEMFFHSRAGREWDVGTGVGRLTYYGGWHNSTTNVTSIQIVAAVANAIGIGSVISLYKVTNV